MIKKITIALLGLSLLIMGFFIYRLFAEVEIRNHNQLVRLESIYAQQASAGIQFYFRSIKKNLAYLAAQTSIRDLTSEGKVKIRAFYDSNPEGIRGITRIDKNGIIQYTYPDSSLLSGTDVSNQEHNRLIMETHKPVVSEVFMAKQGFRAVAYAFPVFKNGKYDGCISFLVSFEYIAKSFIETIKLGRDGYAIVISKSGIELYCPNPAHIGHSVFNTSGAYQDFIDLVTEAMSGKEGSGSYKYFLRAKETGQIQEKVAYYVPVKFENNFWTIIVTVPYEEYSQFNKQFREDITFIIIAGTISLLLFSFLYIKVQRRAEKKLLESDKKYKIVAEQTGQVIYEYSPATGEIFWHGAISKVLGYSREEMQLFNYESWIKSIHPADRKHTINTLEHSIENYSDFSSEYRCLNKSGEYIYIEDAGVATTLSDGSVIFYGTMKNISQRKKAENELLRHREILEKTVKERTEELENAKDALERDLLFIRKAEESLRVAKEAAEKSEKLKSEFLAQMSHEIRTPINTILNYTSLIQMEIEGALPEDLEGSFEAIETAAHRLLRTINLILNMSEMEAGSYQPNFTRIDLDEVVASLMKEFRKQAETKKLKFEYIPEKPKPYIYADYYTVSQIFANLIENAIKYTKEGSVKVIIKREDLQIKVDVTDTGIGISDSFIPVLFDLFRQEEQGYTRKYEGNGLGLALVKNYIEMNKAEIEVESKKGEGSTFRIIFPEEK